MLIFLRSVTIDPAGEMLKCVLEKRPSGLRNLLFLMFFNYGCYLFLLSERRVSYNYLLRAFDGFDGAAFARLSVVLKLELLVGLFVVVPVFSGRLGWHESGMLSVVTSMSVLSYVAQGNKLKLKF